MAMSDVIPAREALPNAAAEDGFANQLSAMVQASENSEHESVRRQGYPWLRFPAAMEKSYLEDMAGERLNTLRLGGRGIVVLIFTAVVMDLIMVPDQWVYTLVLRLLGLFPLSLVWLLNLDKISIQGREWGLMGLVSASACVMAFQVWHSQSDMAAPYLTGLSLYVLVIGAMVRARFWNAMKVDAVVVGLFALVWWALPTPPLAIMIAAGLALTATVVFTLWGAYRLEYTNRTHWLMLQQERHLQIDLEDSINKLDELSRFDALTHLPNRREFYSHIQKLWTRTRRDGKPVAILLVDIDHFKPFNDTYGHVQGDECLQQVAHALHQSMSSVGGLAARWGGEEFIVVLGDTDLAQATAMGQQALDAVAALRISHGASPTGPWITCSMGVAVVQKGVVNVTPDRLISAADAALYQAKAQGRARLCVHDPEQPFPAGAGVVHSPLRQEGSATLQLEQVAYKAELDALSKPFAGLRFERALETRFQMEMAPRRIRDFLITGVLALGMFNLFLPVDYLLANDVWTQAFDLRLKIYTPFWAVAIVVFWIFRDAISQKFPPWVHELVVLISGVTAGAILSYILASSHGPLVQYYHLGLMVIIIYGNLVQRLRFWFAVAFSAAIYAMHVHGAWVAPTMDSRLILPIVSLVGAAGVFSLMANHAIDADERKNYLMSLRRRGLLDNLQQVHRKLTALVRVDPLTEQFNRRHATDFLQHAWTHAAAAGERMAVIMVDVDHFKAYNDHYGHPEGDRCLVRVAHALATSVRGPTDLVGRYGGEEFIAILTQVEPADAQRVAERMRFAVEQMGLAHDASSAAKVVTVSVGVACMHADARLTADHVLQAADQALYRAKHQGRNRVSV